MTGSAAALLRHQRNRALAVQLLAGVSVALVYAVADPSSLWALSYSVLMGCFYTASLGTCMRLSDYVLRVSPLYASATLYIGAAIRFVLIGTLLALGVRHWPHMPLAVVLPFLVMLCAPVLLLRGRKRLTD